ncbi:MAG: ABC transporter permease subunit [Hyphomicrobiales bacterium]
MSEAALSAGRSLWGDAWLRLRKNRAATWSAAYLLVVVVACLIGPSFTGHEFDHIYQSYVRVPPSLEPYPKAAEVEQDLRDALKRAKVDVVDWQDEGRRISVTVRNPAGVDDRVTRYLDRSDAFDNSQIMEKSADGTEAKISADVGRIHFLLGTDSNGRDVLTRALVAGRVSLAVGLVAGLVAMVIGVIYGAVSGFAGGKTDEVMMRIVDILYSLPFTFFVIMLVVFFGRNFLLMFVAIGAVLWLDMARIVRGQTLSLKRQEFVLAAEALGVPAFGILLRHIIPNMLGPVIIFVTLLVPQVIILESFLSYLGLGIQEPMSSWGVEISEGARNLESAAWLLAVPSVFLTSTLFALNFLGDGLRDALDPKDR